MPAVCTHPQIISCQHRIYQGISMVMEAASYFTMVGK